MRIGQLAKKANVNIETVRFYERKGLIEQPLKPGEGYRCYPLETLERILFIKRAQQLGFTLEEISSLLSMESAQCSEIQQLAISRLTLVRSKLSDLRRIESVLDKLVLSCQNNPGQTDCPIIKTLVHRPVKDE